MALLPRLQSLNVSGTGGGVDGVLCLLKVIKLKNLRMRNLDLSQLCIDDSVIGILEAMTSVSLMECVEWLLMDDMMIDESTWRHLLQLVETEASKGTRCKLLKVASTFSGSMNGH